MKELRDQQLKYWDHVKQVIYSLGMDNSEKLTRIAEIADRATQKLSEVDVYQTTKDSEYEHE